MSFLRLRDSISAAPAYLALSCFGLAAAPAAVPAAAATARKPTPLTHAEARVIEEELNKTKEGQSCGN